MNITEEFFLYFIYRKILLKIKKLSKSNFSKEKLDIGHFSQMYELLEKRSSTF